MPIYEYECDKCGETIEVIQKMSDPDLKKHESCGGELTKLFSVPGFQFKDVSRYGVDSGLSPYSKNSSEYQQAENEIKSKEKAKKPSRVMSTPSGVKAKGSSSKKRK
jgi:putative FmdB family regulatory protein